jgi:hypothetical protein
MMAPDRLQQGHRLPGSSRSAGPLLRYAVGWLLAAGAAVLVAVLAIRALDRGDPPRSAPMPAGVLASARAAGCSFTRLDGPAARSPDTPTVVGRVRSSPAPDAAYAQAPRAGELLAALARGRIVIQYRPTVATEHRVLLERLYDRDRSAIILTPDTSGMEAVVTATAWRRTLACRRIDRRVLEAIAEFRDRFRGSGPE